MAMLVFWVLVGRYVSEKYSTYIIRAEETLVSSKRLRISQHGVPTPKSQHRQPHPLKPIN